MGDGSDVLVGEVTIRAYARPEDDVAEAWERLVAEIRRAAAASGLLVEVDA